MKNTLARLKTIFSANLNYFVLMSIFTAILYGILYLLIVNTDTSVEKVIFTKDWFVVFTILVAVMPIASYISFNWSNYSSGIKSSEINTKIAKRNLFLAAGVLWSSAACLVISVTSDSIDVFIFASAIVFLIIWHFIFKTLTKYVFTL